MRRGKLSLTPRTCGSRTPRSRRMLPVGHATIAAKAAVLQSAAALDGCLCTKLLPPACPKVDGAIHLHVSQLMHEESTKSAPGALDGRRCFIEWTGPMMIF